MATTLQTLVDRTGETCRNGHPRLQFARLRRRGDQKGEQWTCGECERLKVRRYRAKMSPGVRAEQSRRHDLKANYGITVEDWDAMYEGQNGCCGICGRDRCSTGKRFAVDHNHETGEVRGLLCYRCNALVGTLEGTPGITASALAWIER